MIKFHLSLYLGVLIEERPTSVQVMAWRLFGAKPLPEPVMCPVPTLGLRELDTNPLLSLLGGIIWDTMRLKLN